MNHTITARSLLCWKDCSQRNKEKRCIKGGEIIKGILCLFAALLFVASCGGGGGGGNSSIPNNDSVMDADGDGIADATDNCPSISNPDQRDDDQDGIGDTCDALIDTDGDGIADAADNCPFISNPDQRDDDQDGIGRACDTSENLPPTADAGPDRTVDERTEVLLSGSGTDPNGTISSYSWVQTEGRTVALSGADTQSASFTTFYVESDEELVFRLTVTDDENTTATDTVNITVRNSDLSLPLPIKQPAYVFGDQVIQEEQQEFREDMEFAINYIRDRTGQVINTDLTVYVFRDRENFLDAYIAVHFGEAAPEETREEAREEAIETLEERGDSWGFFNPSLAPDGVPLGPIIFIYGDIYFSNEYVRLLVMVHEHFHAIQIPFLDSNGYSPDTGPYWFIEGSARYLEAKTLEYLGEDLYYFGYSEMQEMDRARNINAPLEALETFEAFFDLAPEPDGASSYSFGALAAAFLADNYGSLETLVHYYNIIGPDMPWKEAFQNAFGISINEFYREFGQYRSENFPPSPTPSVEQHRSEGFPPLPY